MGKFIDLTGSKYGRLVVLNLSKDKDKQGKIQWLCRCDCGTVKLVRAKFLRNGETSSCGCLHIDVSRVTAKNNFSKHNLHNHPLYTIWSGMKQRCYYSKASNYKFYGGRGIKMCNRWRVAFKNFYDDMIPTWKPGLSIDRKNVNGNYQFSNCRWTTNIVQANNRRSSQCLKNR